MHNRRKYDRNSVHDLLAIHEEEDMERFTILGKRLIRIELAVYGAATALALFIFLIDHPAIIHNLTAQSSFISSGYAESMK